VIRLFGDGTGETPEALRAICGVGAPAPTKGHEVPAVADLCPTSTARTRG